MNLVCLGDSLVYGYGVPRKDCWACLAAERTGHTLVNRGINGDTTGGMLSRFRPDVIAEAPHRVLLLGGANDILTSGGDSAARSNLSAMVYQALDAGIRPMVGLYPPFCPDPALPSWPGAADPGTLGEVFQAYRVWCLQYAASAGVPLVDFSQGFDGPHLYLDQVHPNRAGHAVMADVLCRVLSS